MEAAELSPDQVTELNRDLLQLRKTLDDVLSVSAEGARPVSLDQPIGRLSRMDALQQQSMTQANRRNHRRRLQQVGMALAALARGDYGFCRRCEEPIGYPRLKARPETPFCVACQSRTERAP